MTLKVAGQGTSTSYKLSCVDEIYRQVRAVITYNFCVRGKGSNYQKNDCITGGDVRDLTFTFSRWGPNYYNFKKKSNYPFWVIAKEDFSQADYDQYFSGVGDVYCTTYVPLVHATMQWREVDLATNTWKNWHTKWKPGIPKKSLSPYGWGKAITCPPV